MNRGQILRLGSGGQVIGRPAAPSPDTGSPPLPDIAPGLTTGKGGPGRFVLLLILLPMFGQFFHYMIDSGPLYYLSKAWPFLTLPLALYAILTIRSPQNGLYLAALAYTLGVTPVLSMLHLGNGFVDAAATTVKVWPYLYYFAVLSLLGALQPSLLLIRRVWLWLAALCLISLWLFWALVPAGRYGTDPTVSRLFLFEVERGYRIFMPMLFVLGMMFYCARRWLFGGRWLAVVPLGIGLASMVMIHKQRTTLLMALAVLGLLMLRRLPRGQRFMLLTLAVIAGGVFLWLGPIDVARIADSFGASLTIRLATIEKIIVFLSGDPLRWMFGIGSITRFSERTLADIFGTRNFYLADVGWLGVVFEYGVAGAIVILAVIVGSLREVWRHRADPDPFVGAVSDLLLLLALETLVYSPVFTPGIAATLMALLVYRRRLLRAEPAGELLPAAPVTGAAGRGGRR